MKIINFICRAVAALYTFVAIWWLTRELTEAVTLALGFSIEGPDFGNFLALLFILFYFFLIIWTVNHLIFPKPEIKQLQKLKKTMNKKILMLVLLGFVWASSVSASQSLELSANVQECGKVKLQAEIISESSAFFAYLDDSLIGSGSVGAGSKTWLQTKELSGAHVFKFKIVAGEDSVEKSVEFDTKLCGDNAGGGGLAPCQLLGTCPNFGDTEWENGHKPYPKGGVEAQNLAQTRLLMFQLIETLNQLLSKLVALKNLR